MPSATRKRTAEDCRKVLDKLRRTYQHLPNATGFDVGYCWTDGARTDELCVRVHVTAKTPDALLSKEQMIAKEIDGVRVDVITGPYKVRREFGFGQNTPEHALLSGSACKRQHAGTGTIGAIAIDKATGAPGILSNWHVLSTFSGEAGDPIYGEGDSRTPIATLQKSMLSRHGDAAFAPLTGTRAWYPALKELNINLSGVRPSTLGHILCKYGRASGLTRARVDGEGFYKVLHLVAPGEYQAIEIEGFRLVPEDGAAADTEISMPGDSGACWVSPNSGVVAGLHMAGEGETLPEGEYALACNMQTVLDQMDLTLATLDDLIEHRLVPPAATPQSLAANVANAPLLSPPPQGFTPHPWCPNPPVWPPRPDWPPVPPGPVGPLPPWPPLPWPPTPWPPAPWPPVPPQPWPFNDPLADAFGATPQAGQAYSVSGNIWQEFKRCMLARYPHLVAAQIKIDDPIRDAFQSGIISALMRKIILTSPMFTGDGAVPSIHDLEGQQIYRGICIKIGEEYRALGFVVTA